MIAEISFKNFFSFKEESVFSFEADDAYGISEDLVVDLGPVRLLKVAVVYGANASGKSNLVDTCQFIKHFTSYDPKDRDMPIALIPFLFTKSGRDSVAEFSVSFYPLFDSTVKRYTYSAKLSRQEVREESLVINAGESDESLIFRRSLEDHGLSVIEFSDSSGLDKDVQQMLTVQCLPNMSVLALIRRLNTRGNEISKVSDYFFAKLSCLPVNHEQSPSFYAAIKVREDAEEGEYLQQYLSAADFNIAKLSLDIESELLKVPGLSFIHQIKTDTGEVEYYALPRQLESSGTLRTLDLAALMHEAIKNDVMLVIDELDSSLHVLLTEYILSRFLRESTYAQLLITTHYSGLLDNCDLLRQDCFWFVEKDAAGVSHLYSLIEFKEIGSLPSLQNSYQHGLFGAVPNL